MKQQSFHLARTRKDAPGAVLSPADDNDEEAGHKYSEHYQAINVSPKNNETATTSKTKTATDIRLQTCNKPLSAVQREDEEAGPDVKEQAEEVRLGIIKTASNSTTGGNTISSPTFKHQCRSVTASEGGRHQACAPEQTARRSRDTIPPPEVVLVGQAYEDNSHASSRPLTKIVTIICIILLLVGAIVFVGTFCASGQCKQQNEESTSEILPNFCNNKTTNDDSFLQPGSPYEIIGLVTKVNKYKNVNCGVLSDIDHGLVYEIIGTGGLITASTCSSLTKVDTAISLYTGDCDDVQCIMSSTEDNTCDSEYASSLSWLSNVGQKYYIFVRIQGQDNFILTMSTSEPLMFGIFKNHAYSISEFGLSWSTANLKLETDFRLCGKHGYLATITSEEENEFISSVVVGNTWIGGFQDPGVSEIENVDHGLGWSWVNGEGSFPAGIYNNIDNEYENWYPGQPYQPAGTNADCLFLNPNEHDNIGWHDGRCEAIQPFAVEVDLVVEATFTIDSCDTGLRIDPLLQIENGDDQISTLSCTYLSDAILFAAETTTTNKEFVESVQSMVASLVDFQSITDEQATRIIDCAVSSRRSLI